MASPADSSGLNTPLARSMRSAPAFAPAARLNAAIAAPETLLSAVTTTRPDAASVYQAMPSTPDASTAAPTAASAEALFGCDAAAAGVEDMNSPAARVPTAKATTLLIRRCVRLGTILTDFSFASQRDPDQRIEGT